MEGRLLAEEETIIVDGTRELIADAAAFSHARAARQLPSDSGGANGDRVRIFGYPVNSVADELALQMLGQILQDVPGSIEVCSERLGSSEITARVRDEGYGIVCIADLPPSAPSKTRYLVKKLRASFPDLKIVVGRWAPPSLVDDSAQPLLDAGATHVTSTLLETRDRLSELVQSAQPAIIGPAEAGHY
jgi:hypothetical protein